MSLRHLLSIITFGLIEDNLTEEPKVVPVQEKDIQEQFAYSKDLRNTIRAKAEDIQTMCNRSRHAA